MNINRRKTGRISEREQEINLKKKEEKKRMEAIN
jgi:hypothetical protein